MSEDKVRRALALLEQAGRTDLLKPEALVACPASAGVAAAVMACSPPCAETSVCQVRREGRAAGGMRRRGAAWACPGEAGRRAAGTRPMGKPKKAGCAPHQPFDEDAACDSVQGEPGPARVSMGARPRAGAKTMGGGHRRVRRTPPLLMMGAEGLREPPSREDHSGDRAPSGAREGEEVVGPAQTSEAGGGVTGEWQHHSGDPRVPLSKKWPTMLQWSSSEEEAEQEQEVGGWSGEDPP
ncbi:hypothetical protein NDU88_003875 [Pleurodeles waltl]|uniref:Uncharacterized protein n=1 Tax=Pleurodeles waltl TaxID=8319 RepID=A0AAV7W3D4_PLEWA|nr:hypothetical protein NDU88_003875 [Pleurodeles waltl]